MSNRQAIPEFEADFWSDEVILDPYPYYERLRELGPVVWMSRHQAYALTRYDAVRHALTTPTVFSSAHGCMMNEPMNTATKGIMLCSDGEEHRAMRRLFAKPLTPKALADTMPRLRALAATRVQELVAQPSFDAVHDLAHHLPMAVVAELVGLDAEGRARMLDWAKSIFDGFGPIDQPRTVAAIDVAGEVVSYVLERLDRRDIAPGGWGEALFLAADRGEISERSARMMLIDYLTPSLDTTINAISAAVELFANNPIQWDLLREDPGLIPHAIDEVLRLESPIRAFARLVTQVHEVEGIRLEAGARALMLYACANRDPRKYPDADRFVITRKPGDHLAFGAGPHVCAGLFLAKIEMTVLFEAMADKVRRIRATNPLREAHNTLRGLASLETTFEQATVKT